MDRRTFVTLVSSSIPLLVASSALATKSDLPPNTFRLGQQLGPNDLSIRFEEGGFPVDLAYLSFVVTLEGQERKGPNFWGYPAWTANSRPYIKQTTKGHYHLSHIPAGRKQFFGRDPQGTPYYFDVPQGKCQIKWSFRKHNKCYETVVQRFTIL